MKDGQKEHCNIPHKKEENEEIQKIMKYTNKKAIKER